jgi:hypothetical protein
MGHICPNTPTHPEQVKVNALVGSMAADDLEVSGGRVLSVGPPYIQGAFQICDVSAQLRSAEEAPFQWTCAALHSSLVLRSLM